MHSQIILKFVFIKQSCECDYKKLTMINEYGSVTCDSRVGSSKRTGRNINFTGR